MSFDVQVNGYGGVDFNDDDLSLEDFRRACALLEQQGVTSFLPTIITEEVGRMQRRIANIADHCEADPAVAAMVAGIHVEGPFISPKPGFRGAHPEDAIRPADPGIARDLVAAGRGRVRLLTLAPEQDPSGEVTRSLAEDGVCVAAGHTDATVAQLETAIAAGLKMFTHLGNGCPMQCHRHDNIVQRALYLRRHLWMCFIPDGVHVDFPALRNYIDLAGVDRSIVTTDAMSAAGLGPGVYRIGRWEIQIGEDCAARSPDGSHLIGSAMSWPMSEQNLRGPLGFTEAEIRLMSDSNPRAALGTI